MNRFAKSLCVLLLGVSMPVCLAAAPESAPQAGAGRGGAAAARGPGVGGGQAAAALNREFYASEMETLVQVLPITDAQKAKLQEKVNTMNREIDTFLQDAPAQVAAARGRGGRGANPGRAGRGAATAPPVAGTPNPAVVRLQDDLQQLIDQHQILIDQELTPEQRVPWENYKLQRILNPRLRPLSLTDDQQDKIRGLLEQTAAALAASADSKAFAALQGKLFRKIVADVLTDAQVSRFVQGALQVQGPGRGAQTAPAVNLP